MFNPNGASSIVIEMDAPEAGTNNIYFNVLRAMPDLKRHLG
jgi:hypothetical protein